MLTIQLLIYSMKKPVLFDATPIGRTFGAVLVDVNTNTSYQAGQVVSAKFVGANPRVRTFHLKSMLCILPLYSKEQSSPGRNVPDR